MKKLIKEFFAKNFPKTPKSIAVGVSGGVDSMALLFALDEFCNAQKVALHAVTIDHKMRENSSKEVLELAKICAKHKISHKILTIDEAQIPLANIEANLREARYDLLYGFCIKNKIQHLFLGHHQNDAAENFLIRLFRGSQIDGLSKMQEIAKHKKIKLCRPFLSTQKLQLQEFLQARKISHFQDESNEDEKFLRNKIRKFLTDLPESELIQERIVKFSEVLDENRQFLDEILLENAKKCLKFDKKGEFLLNLDEYRKIPPKIALKILSLVVTEIGGNNYKPRLKGVESFESEILNLPNHKRKNFYGCMAQKLKNLPQIVIFREEIAKPKPAQKFDEKTQIIDGRFLQKANAKNPHKFYFRTILGEIFDE